MIDLKKLIERDAPEQQVLDALKPLRYKEIDYLDDVINYFVTNDQYDTPLTDFEYSDETFMDFFDRQLTYDETIIILENSRDADIIIPCEANLRSFGSMDDTENILELKKPTEDVKGDLELLGIFVEGYNYLDFELWVSYYHRIHAPVTGQITKIIPVEGDEDFFGENSLWIVEFTTDNTKPLYMLLVGESSIQDFNWLVDKYNDVDIFEELGYFTWGSQLVLIYPDDYEINLEKNKYFVGCPI
jgi:phosphatidylserine decarboxylase